METKKTIRVASVLVGGLTLLIAPGAFAQCSFSSGSTGADGQFNPPTYVPAGTVISNNVVTVPLPSNGIYNFTSIYITNNYVVKFTRNTLNTPVFLLATTNVTIKGTIDVRGENGLAPGAVIARGGPGGFDGGLGEDVDYGPGHGPGGGDLSGGAGFRDKGGYAGGGQSYGTIDILPLIGGSGAGGWDYSVGAGGSGGGVAVLIASSATIEIPGTIIADSGDCANGGGYYGSRGSAGAIKLVAQTIQGEGTISASTPNWTGGGSVGRIRLEACTLMRSTMTIPPATIGSPGAIFLNPNPTISVTSIASQNTPWPPVGSLTVPDVYLPTNFTNPAAVSVLASNINPGTTFKVIITPVYGTNITATGTLSGSYAASTGSVNINVYTDRVWRVNALIDYIPRP